MILKISVKKKKANLILRKCVEKPINEWEFFRFYLILLHLALKMQKIADKFYICKISKDISKLYHIENSQTSWQTVEI